MLFEIGDLVQGEEFSGIGKIVLLNEAIGIAHVAFFESPVRAESRVAECDLSGLMPASIFDESNVYLKDEKANVWRRARYGSRRPDGKHLVLFKSKEQALVPVGDIYVLNRRHGESLQPLEFLEGRCTDTPLFSEWRAPFVTSYLQQRAACKSIASVLSSSVEIEPHQIAVVRRVLADPIKKYLLADEVGLGKTIEACLIMREHVLQDEENALVIIGVPAGLQDQWRSELIERFYLGDLLDERIFVCSHKKLPSALELGAPTMVVIDEAHHISPWAWSGSDQHQNNYNLIATATEQADVCLLLSGTPLTGNEKNFLAMLHLLAPLSYPLTAEGIASFEKRVVERENLGGMYQALVVDNDNYTLTDIVDEIFGMFSEDLDLAALVTQAKPLIDGDAADSGPERSDAITSLRRYIGENYRLHQRMLRNRREDQGLANLFPGLTGATLLGWLIDDQNLAVDQLLDAYRDEYLSSSEDTRVGVSVSNYRNWLRKYFTSPALVAIEAGRLLAEERAHLMPEEMDLLEYLVAQGKEEQLAKDAALVKHVNQWLEQNPKGKIVVYCGDPIAAGLAHGCLEAALDSIVERHAPPSTPDFQQSPNIRILVCDERGEDGLNLHGGQKHIVHYAIPLSFARIEQRNGRVNRYSATIRARPISTVVMHPDRRSMYLEWVNTLNDAVGIFDRSVASLQYVLQHRMDLAWQKIVAEGVGSLIELQTELAGPEGLLAKERIKVRAQEELNSMDSEVASVQSFASTLDAADDLAELQSRNMTGWIEGALQFQKVAGEINGSFRFKYNTGAARGQRTLVDVESFIRSCITGIDKDESDWSSPVTALMSPDRQVVSHGRQVYPMRFGQPFVDTIYRLSRDDSRGICSVRLRSASGLKLAQPEICFSCLWSVSACGADAVAAEQRLADEGFPPSVLANWINESGNLIVSRSRLSLLAAPYSKREKSLDGFSYRDMNVGADLWQKLEPYYPSESWPSLVRQVGEQSLCAVKELLRQSPNLPENLNYQLEAISAVILIPG